MIADLDETIKQLLITEMPIKNGEIDVNFDQPKREWSARLTKPTVNLFMYDVRENPQLRQFQWQRASNGNGRTHTAAMKRPAIRVDCHYMLTTWAAEPEDEHRLLTRTLMALYRFPTLPRDQLTGRLDQQPYDITTKLAVHDKLTNAAEMWSALDNELRPSIPYIVTVTLDPFTPIEEPMVRTVSMNIGRKKPTAEGEEPELAQLDGGLATIAGTVRNPAQDDAPVANVNIHIQGTGLEDLSDENGRYVIHGLQPGEYTFLATPETGEPVTTTFTVPSDDGDYDIDM
jgi:hypothetical protein